MVFEHLFGKSQVENIRQNKICLWLCYFLLIFYTGCATTREQAREREALRQLNAVIEWELNKENKDLQKDKVLVALYLDTEETENSIAEAEYRCYSRSLGRGGYSGIKKIPYRVPWVTWERFSSNDLRKEIVIDPGPPYKNVTKIVNLIPGEVTNLGRIELEKVKAKGVASVLEIIGIERTASICGTIKDEDGKPLEGVEVSSTKGSTTTNSEGYYRIDGFGLEVCDLKVTKKGYIPNNTKVSIRDMDKRIIEHNFVLSFPRKIRLRYTISPEEKDDFNDIEATGGTAAFFTGENYLPVPVEQIKNDDFRQFISQTRLNFRVNDGRLTLNNSYAPIFYERLCSSSKDFEAINSVGPLNYNSQFCPAIQEGDIILINGGKVSDYTVKILFEEIQRILP
jgi:hypothetical protein